MNWKGGISSMSAACCRQRITSWTVAVFPVPGTPEIYIHLKHKYMNRSVELEEIHSHAGHCELMPLNKCSPPSASIYVTCAAGYKATRSCLCECFSVDLTLPCCRWSCSPQSCRCPGTPAPCRAETLAPRTHAAWWHRYTLQHTRSIKQKL